MELGQKLGRIRDRVVIPTDRELNGRLRGRGIDSISAVACSVTATMHAEWQDRADVGQLKFTPTSHEHSLAGLAAGYYLATGRLALIAMQNSGLPNAMDGLISHAAVNRIPVLALVTWRGDSPEDDSEPHQEIGRRTVSLTNDAVDSGNVFGDRLGRGILRALDKAIDNAENGSVSILRLSPRAFKKTYTLSAKEIEPEGQDALEQRMAQIKAEKGSDRREVLKQGKISREEAIQEVRRLYPNAAIFFANGYNARAGQEVDNRQGDYYMTGYMGGAMANGWAYARESGLETVVVDGDQNAQMSCMKDNLTAEYPPNLHWVIMDNGMGASVGVARSIPLAPSYYDLARVIRTIPDGLPGEFQHPRVKAKGDYFETDEGRRLAQELGGPLPAMTVMFRMWTEQQKQQMARFRN